MRMYAIQRAISSLLYVVVLLRRSDYIFPANFTAASFAASAPCNPPTTT
jgi:hypothetical protein